MSEKTSEPEPITTLGPADANATAEVQPAKRRRSGQPCKLTPAVSAEGLRRDSNGMFIDGCDEMRGRRVWTRSKGGALWARREKSPTPHSCATTSMLKPSASRRF